MLDYLLALWLVTVQMAPWLLLGFLMAGLLSVYVSPRWLERHLGGGGMGPVWKASLFGVPLPLCSCGVIPVGASMRRHGASKAATVAFLISTPQTGVDSIAVTGGLLGPVMAVLRPVIALVTGMLGGALVRAVDHGDEAAPASAADLTGRPADARSRLIEAFRYGFFTLPRDIGRPLVVGLALAALITALVPADALAGLLGSGLLPILMMMVVAVPLYVCATGSVPVAAGFIHAGVSPGAALAFLIAGPATNAAMLATLVKILGKRITVVYLATVALSAVVGGLALDLLLGASGWAIAALPSHHGHDQVGWLDHAWGGLLVANLVWVFLPRRRSRLAPPAAASDAGASGAPAVLVKITGMSCGHCRDSVERALGELPGVRRVVVDLERGEALVHGQALDAGALEAAVDAAGFSARVAPSG